MAENRLGKRKKLVYSCPNPLFEEWLKEWRDEAVRNGWKTQHTFNKALKSLQRYPLPLASGQEAKILEHFGDKICGMLDKKLTEHEHNSQGSSKVLQNDASNKPKPKKNPFGEPKRPKEYIPTFRSGAYALLVTLCDSEENDLLSFMKKADLLSKAQQHCDVSFTVPEPNSHYTAWSSMSTLIRKNFITKEGNPARYSLTETGRNLSQKLLQHDSADDKILPSIPTKSYPAAKVPRYEVETTSADDIDEIVEDSFTLNAGTFDVILCVDNCETTPGIATNRKSSLLPELRRNGVAHDVRKLNVGDFLWVARERVLPTPGQLQLDQAKELVLDFVVERKRLDDLAQSIKDGRFHEQKFRLKNSGIRRPVYLVEDFGSGNLGLPDSTLQQAVVNTQVVDGFTIKHTKDQKESVAYLTLMTRYLQSTYCNRTLTSCSVDKMTSSACPPNSFLAFQQFNTTAFKNKKLQVKEIFLKQLLQIHGLSLEKAVALTELYPTPLSLIKAYESCMSTSEKEKLVASVKFGKNLRNLGPSLSKVIYYFYNTKFS